MEEGLQIWKVTANIMSRQLKTADKRWPLAWGLGELLTTPHRKNLTLVTNHTERTEKAGCCECVNVPVVSIKCWEFLHQLRNC